MAEKEYIEREALLDRACAVRDKLQLDLNNPFEDGVRVGFENVEIEIENYPAADVRPVVLCRDCKWCHAGYCEKFDDIIPWGVAYRPWEDWFCADGEKREEQT